MNVLVSVIIPVYNTAEFLDKCLLSVTNQSYAHLEIIIVNDGSTDNSEFICKQFASKDSRIKYIYKANGGLSSARNTGIEAANGEYISFIDSDDFIDRDFINILLSACLDNKSTVAICGRIIVSESSEKHLFVFSTKQIWKSIEAAERMLTWNGLDGSVCDKLFHRSLLENNRFPLGQISEDLPVLVNILIKAGTIVHVGKALYYYFQRNNSITKSGFSKIKMSILLSSIEVRRNVIVNYPSLKKKADFYHFHHLLYLRSLLVGIEKDNVQELRFINGEINKDLLNFLLNPYLPIKRKLKFFLVNFIYFLKKSSSIYYSTK